MVRPAHAQRCLLVRLILWRSSHQEERAFKGGRKWTQIAGVRYDQAAELADDKSPLQSPQGLGDHPRLAASRLGKFDAHILARPEDQTRLPLKLGQPLLVGGDEQ